MKRICIYTIIVINLLSFSFSAHSQALKYSEIDKLLNHYAQNGMFNGCILVAEGTEIIYEGAFGYSDFENKTKLKIDDVFGIGSIAKQFTATGIMILVESGELHLDDKLTDFFPEFEKFEHEITLYHLLTHTSGLFDYANELGMDLNNQMETITPKEAFDKIIGTNRLKFKPGEKRSYSNSGYFLLSLIIEKVAGKSYREFITENIFNPLGMESSCANDYLDSSLITRVKSYEFMNELDWDLKLKVNGDGGLYSTVHDVLLWNQSLSNGKLLNENSLSAVFQPTALNDGKKIDYGFGWDFQLRENGKLVYHRGAIAGFRCHNEYNLTNRHSIIIFTNDALMSEILEVSNNVRNILNNQPVNIKKRPLSNYLFELWYLRELSETHDSIEQITIEEIEDKYSISEDRLNTLGYFF